MKIKYSLLGIVAITFMTLYACRKDISSNPTNKLKNDVFTVDKAKSYLDSALGTSGTLKVQSIDSSKKNNLGVIYWKYARELKSRSYQFVEIPLIIDKKSTPLYDFPKDSVKIKPDATVGLASFSRIVVYKDTINKTIDKRIVTYIPDKAYLLKHNNDASKNWLNKLDDDFSGYLEYRTFSGKIQSVLRIVNGKQKAKYNVTNGAATSKAQINQNQINSVKPNTVKTNVWSCYIIETRWLVAQCLQIGENLFCDAYAADYTVDLVCDDYNEPPTGPGPSTPPLSQDDPNAPYSPVSVDVRAVTVYDPGRPGAGRPISSTEGFFDCFDTTLEGAVYIYVREPSAGTGNIYHWDGTYNGEYDLGEAFVGFTQYNSTIGKVITRVFGFAPQSAIAPYSNTQSAPSMLVDKGGQPFTISVFKYYTITNTQFADAVNYVKNGLYPSTFNLNTFNSLDFAEVIAAKVGLNSLTDALFTNWWAPYTGPWSSPGRLGYTLRSSWVEPAGQTINSTPGNAEANEGTCP